MFRIFSGSLKKKGDLSLSINAIVIIVLAMTLLGLGLGFIRGLFRDITETTGTVQEQVKQQILEDLRTGDKRLSFSTTNLNIQRGAKEIISFGVRNSKNVGELDFMVFVEALQKEDLSGERIFCKNRAPAYFKSPEVATPEATWECDPSGTQIEGVDFFYNFGPHILSLDEAEVFPVTVTAKQKGTYLVKLSILDNAKEPQDDGAEVSDGIYGEGPGADNNEEGEEEHINEVYAAKTFFINVI